MKINYAWGQVLPIVPVRSEPDTLVAAPSRILLTLLSILACFHHSSALGQQPAPPNVDLASFAAKRFPQPVRVGDLIHRSVLEPKESRPVLGHVALVIQLNDGSQAIVVEYGGLWGLGSRDIAVPINAMVLLGAELEILDFTPAQLARFPTYAGAGRMLGADQIIRMGLAHPSH